MNLNGHMGMVAAPTKAYKLVQSDFATMVERWTYVRKGLGVIKKKDKRSGNWTTEHVRAMLEAGFKGQGTCELWFVLTNDEVPVGFVITSIGPDPHLSVPLGLFIWITYLELRHTKAFDSTLDRLEAIARQRGLRYVEGMSSRLGWVEKLMRRGFDTHMTLFRKNVWGEEG